MRMDGTTEKWEPRHLWYLCDAQLLIRQLQEVAWPLGWHIALGGGVLNHGYSDKDVDIYALPIYSQEGKLADELEILSRLIMVLNPEGTMLIDEVCSTQAVPHECYHYSVRIANHGKPIELFIVKRTYAPKIDA